MVYAMWTPGDELPKTTPKDCEFLYGNHNEWNKEEDHPSLWNHRCRRWPVELPEPRPTAFGLLSEEEQAELEKAHELDPLEVWAQHTGWKRKSKGTKLFGDGIYRKGPEPQDRKNTAQPEPKQPEITVTVNGELIDFRVLVRQEIARIQAESKS